MNTLLPTEIDLNKLDTNETLSEHSNHSSVASLTLELGGIAIKFAQVERAPRFNETHKENDAEHSFMLALTAGELAARYYPNMDTGMITQFAIGHDLIELVEGDIPTFQFTASQMADKQAAEHAALSKLLAILPPHTAQLVYEYEQQQAVEARFVKAVDKLLPVVTDILGAGRQVMKEDYGVTTLEQLKDSHKKLHTRIAASFQEFPLIVQAHAALCQLFQEEFELAIR
ncbi:MAG: hypothetical protein JWO54_274 [Candidatus Saccharibacteria bacterium]|nr:hypothetical protein [Candidatus Saccharibacteria bacterium]